MFLRLLGEYEPCNTGYLNYLPGPATSNIKILIALSINLYIIITAS